MVSAEQKLHRLLEQAAEQEWSDIHISAGRQVYFRCANELRTADMHFSPDEIDCTIGIFLNGCKAELLRKNGSADCSYEWRGRRFRINIYRTMDGYSAAIRLIRRTTLDIASFDRAGSLKQLLEAALGSGGLILVCGATGSGKSSTLAAMIDYISRTHAKHIITLEEPIEFIFDDGRSLIHQREYIEDFQNFNDAVKEAMRQDPDVIMVGEIRDEFVMKSALDAAETGHLVLSTLHAASAAEALMRIEGFFPAIRAEPVRAQTAGCLAGVIAQCLLTGAGGLVCCMEILLASAAVKNIIRRGDFSQLATQMQLNREMGMQTMETARQRLAAAGLI